MQFTDEQIKALAKIEREMDNGNIPHVVNKGMRWATNPDVMKHFDLVSGQNVCGTVIQAILDFNLTRLQKNIAEQTTQDAVEKMMSR